MTDEKSFKCIYCAQSVTPKTNDYKVKAFCEWLCNGCNYIYSWMEYCMVSSITELEDMIKLIKEKMIKPNSDSIEELEKEFEIWKTEEYTEKENSKRIEKLEKYHVNVEWINKELKELKASSASKPPSCDECYLPQPECLGLVGICIDFDKFKPKAMPYANGQAGSARQTVRHKDCMNCDNQSINYSNVCQKCSDFCYWKEEEPTGPDQGASMGDNIPDYSEVIKMLRDISKRYRRDGLPDKEKEPTELYPSPYSKEQENLGKYVRVEKGNLEFLFKTIELFQDRINDSKLSEIWKLEKKYLGEEDK